MNNNKIIQKFDEKWGGYNEDTPIAVEWEDDLISLEKDIRSDAKWKFVEWLVNRGYLDRDDSEWRDDEYCVNEFVNSILNRYEKEQENE